MPVKILQLDQISQVLQQSNTVQLATTSQGNSTEKFVLLKLLKLFKNFELMMKIMTLSSSK